jgi:hypothetical protein
VFNDRNYHDFLAKAAYDVRSQNHRNLNAVIKNRKDRFMDNNKPQPEESGKPGRVNVSDWLACLNGNDNQIVLACSVTAQDSSAGITGVGLMLNNEKGLTLASSYTSFSSGSESANPSINLPAGALGVGAIINAVVSGQCGGQHFFFEEQLTVSACS